MQAKQEEAETLLLMFLKSNTDHWRTILQRSKGVEPCGRHWKRISPLEYAAWAGDTFMVTMLLSHIPNDYKFLALEQLKNIRDNGTEHGKHLSALKSLIEVFYIGEKNFMN